MGVITISMDDEKERKLREYAKLKYGERKGALSTAITNAITKEIEENQKRVTEELMQIIKKGYHMGKIKIKHRSELYDRN